MVWVFLVFRTYFNYGWHVVGGDAVADSACRILHIRFGWRSLHLKVDFLSEPYMLSLYPYRRVTLQSGQYAIHESGKGAYQVDIWSLLAEMSRIVDV